MFYLLAIISLLGYCLQTVLLAPYARKIDGLSLAFYRNISFIITLLPLLIGSSMHGFFETLTQWPLLLSSGIAGGLYLGLLYETYKFLPIGIANSMSKAVVAVALAVAGWIFLHQALSPLAIILLAVIVVFSVVLGWNHTPLPHLKTGMALAVVSGFFVSWSNLALAMIAIKGNAFAAGYLWEVFIGFGAGIVICARHITLRKPLQKINAQMFRGIAIAAFPTLIGTGCFSIGLLYGPIAVLNAIGTASLVFTSVLAWKWHRERLGNLQWFAIGIICCCVMGMKFVN